MDRARKVAPWTVVAIAAFLSALIWALSPAISGHREPWDGEGVYYLVALPVAGFLSGLLVGKPFWLQYFGAVLGQIVFGLLFLEIGPLVLIGAGFVATYALLFLTGAFLGERLRGRVTGRNLVLVAHHNMSPGPITSGRLFLASYSGQSAEELIAMEATHRIDSIVLAFYQAIQLKRETQAISREEHYVLAVGALEREVNNGGYARFFLSASNEFASIIVAALYAIDCPKAANITQDAIAALGVVGELTSKKIEAVIGAETESVKQRLRQCDAQYFSNDEIIVDRLFRWIEENRRQIQIG